MTHMTIYIIGSESALVLVVSGTQTVRCHNFRSSRFRSLILRIMNATTRNDFFERSMASSTARRAVQSNEALPVAMTSTVRPPFVGKSIMNSYSNAVHFGRITKGTNEDFLASSNFYTDEIEARKDRHDALIFLAKQQASHKVKAAINSSSKIYPFVTTGISPSSLMTIPYTPYHHFSKINASCFSASAPQSYNNLRPVLNEASRILRHQQSNILAMNSSFAQDKRDIVATTLHQLSHTPQHSLCRPAPVQLTKQAKYFSKAPLLNDVCLGRGKRGFKNEGNQRFLDMVTAKKEDYVVATKKQKGTIAQSVVQQVHSMGGRFIELHSQTALWFVVEDSIARDKTSRALREGAREIRMQLAKRKLKL